MWSLAKLMQKWSIGLSKFTMFKSADRNSLQSHHAVQMRKTWPHAMLMTNHWFRTTILNFTQNCILYSRSLVFKRLQRLGAHSCSKINSLFWNVNKVHERGDFNFVTDWTDGFFASFSNFERVPILSNFHGLSRAGFRLSMMRFHDVFRGLMGKGISTSMISPFCSPRSSIESDISNSDDDSMNAPQIRNKCLFELRTGVWIIRMTATRQWRFDFINKPSSTKRLLF